MGFPMAAGYRRGHVIHYLVGARPGKKVLIPIGEVDGRITPRLQQIGRILASMNGFDAELRTDMDAWLKTHVALLMPSLAPAMRAAGRDNLRMARTRDLLVLAVRAIREGFAVLRALGVPIVPSQISRFGWIPEPIMVWGLQRLLVDPRVRVALFEHADAAQDEIKHLADEFMALKRQTRVPTPAMDRLYAYFNPETPRMPDGSAEIPLDWREVEIGLGVLAAALAMLFASRWLKRRKS
jgi:2-dehydropantoate 2-reductase